MTEQEFNVIFYLTGNKNYNIINIFKFTFLETKTNNLYLLFIISIIY